MMRLIAIGPASEALGVSVTTLRRWEAQGKLIPERPRAGHRRYDLAKLRPELFHIEAAERRTVAYARVSGHDQKDDLERQKQVLELYCGRQGWAFEVVADLGSGMNYHKKGLKRLPDDVVAGRMGRLVITHKDRLLRFGAELIFAICAAKNIEVVILNQGEDTAFEEDLAKDVHDRFTLTNDQFSIDGTRMRVPKLGWVRMREPLRFAGKMVSATISRVADRWFVGIAVELSGTSHLPEAENQGAVGVDLGVSAFATLSTGETIVGPKAHQALLQRQRRLCRNLNRKEKGSANRRKEKGSANRRKAKLARLHAPSAISARMRSTSSRPVSHAGFTSSALRI